MKKLLLTISLILLSFTSISPVHASDADMRNTYMVTWTLEVNDANLFKTTLKEQMDKVLELWVSGTIENVYLDNKKSEVIVRKGDVGKVIFFIKAKTENEAQNILDELPLAKKKIASYQLTPAGVLWLKQY
ncbi:hypothetical protein OH458_06860 [Vibrio sp. MarTm2]|uniref:hypothetical protein n=1 Tax=Vibrio TaxID=662 RepID=UPI0011B3EEAD|nr:MULTISPECIES: hypothetical protein [Vibrio]EJE8516173.1 hypothetical protein [Vibrio parahaemolyticus]EJE8774969.1 hypothetical protein [Vibrio parahaemolyticus]MCR9301694.1 hypothetical protein [Vibrio diabolicus]MCR9427540.1 hypothetical protein [Vibrio diabolicus]MDA0127791.1 hypothetical protein [Vibrio sp. MarTm2]